MLNFLLVVVYVTHAVSIVGMVVAAAVDDVMTSATVWLLRKNCHNYRTKPNHLTEVYMTRDELFINSVNVRVAMVMSVSVL